MAKTHAGTPLLRVLIQRFLKNPNAPPNKDELRALINDGKVRRGKTPTGRTMRALPRKLGGVSFIPYLNHIGVHEVPRAKNAEILWAQHTAALLGQIPLTDQDDIVQKYSHITSEYVGRDNIYPGFFYSYQYEAKTTNNFDRFPIMLCLNRYEDGFLGLNFHYLPHVYRFALFEAMMPLIAPVPVSLLSEILITYKKLKYSTKYRGWKPIIKRYLFKQMRSRVVFISPIEWPVALAFPSEAFVGKPKTQVWTESVQKLI